MDHPLTVVGGWVSPGATILDWADARIGEPVVVCAQVANLPSRGLAERLGFTG